MKKILLILLIVLLSSFVLAEDIAYVVRNPSNYDYVLTGVLNQLNLSYDLIDDSAIASTNFSNYGMILLGDENINNAPINNYKSLFMDAGYYSGWSSFSGSISSNRPLFANNTNMNSSITFGLTGKFQAYTSCCSGSLSLPMYYLDGRKYSITRITSTIPNSGEFVIATKENPRRVFFGIIETNYWTDASRQLFINSLTWVLNGEDRDGDGFYAEEDCNDNNPNINPDAEEIPYDGLDNDCIGGDLADVDGDGFDSEIVGGDDCDDDNPEINPDATEIVDDIDQNCRNDAPVFNGTIPSQQWNEDESLVNAFNLDNYFYDADGDILAYSINSTSDNQEINLQFNGSLVSFDSTEDWNGNDWVIFMASDNKGGVALTNNISLQVNAVNDAPELENIEEVYVIEGEIAKVISNATDVDGDSLTFRFSLPLNSSGEWQTEIGDAGTYTANVSVSDGLLTDTKQVRIYVLSRIYINELLSSGFGNDWLEIYNPGNISFGLDNCEFKDFANNSLDLSGSLTGKSFLVFEWSNRLNKDGDVISLICNNMTIDEVAYGDKGSLQAPGEEESLARIEDGGEEWQIFEYPTRGLSNKEDMIPPVVSLIVPENNSLLLEYNVSFNFTAYDNKALNLNCTLSLYKENQIKEAGSLTIENGTNTGGEWTYLEDGNYFWKVICFDARNYGYSENRSFSVDYQYAPVLQPINEININEGEEARIVANASDVDDDLLTYLINDSRFTQNNNEFVWLTGYNDSGTYYFLINVSDGSLNDEQEVKIVVNDTNQPPYIFIANQTGDQSIEEDSGNNYVEINASDNDGGIESFNVAEENESQVDCEVIYTDYLLRFKPADNWYGTAGCKIEAVDNAGGKASVRVYINVTNVNDAPYIVDYTPRYNPKIGDNMNQELSITLEDIDNPIADLIAEWFVNGAGVDHYYGNSFVFNSSEAGIYNVSVKVNDTQEALEHSWMIEVSEIPLTEKYNGMTTNFSEVADLSNANLILEILNMGRIEFLDGVDLRDIVDIDKYSIIERGFLSINTDIFPEFKNKKARISFYNLSFEKTPTIYYNQGFNLSGGAVCPESICPSSNISYANNTLSFIVNSFSSYSAGDTRTCSEQVGKTCNTGENCTKTIEARDTNACCIGTCIIDFKEVEVCENPDSRVLLNIKEPDNNEEFYIGESIEGKVEIKNDFDDDKDFNIEVSLYDATEQEEIKELDEDFSIDENDKENYEFSINLDDLDEDNRYYVYVYAEDDDNRSICNSAYNEVKIKRKKHDVAIKEFKIEPETASCNSFVDATIKVKNTGKKDEDAYIILENKALGISEESSNFKLDSDDKHEEKLSFKVPELNGTYLLEARVVYNGEETTQETEIEITCREMIEDRKEFELIKLVGKKGEIGLLKLVGETGEEEGLKLVEEKAEEKVIKLEKQEVSDLDLILGILILIVSILIAVVVIFRIR